MSIIYMNYLNSIKWVVEHLVALAILKKSGQSPQKARSSEIRRNGPQVKLAGKTNLHETRNNKEKNHVKSIFDAGPAGVREEKTLGTLSIDDE